MPKPHRGLISAYRTIIPAIFKQSKDKNHFIDVKVPDTHLVSFFLLKIYYKYIMTNQLNDDDFGTRDKRGHWKPFGTISINPPKDIFFNPIKFLKYF